AAVHQLDFLKKYEDYFTVAEASKLIRILFPTKTKSIQESHNSYGIKHLFERISGHVITTSDARKYCSNDTVIEAFEKEGFKKERCGPNSPNWFFNIAEKDLKKAYRLFR